MKYLILAAALSFSIQASAIVECGGRASDGTFVTVHVNTTGAMGFPDQGTVTMELEGNKFGYRFGRDEIPQFFEFDDAARNSAVVGLSAYVEKEFPLSVKYVGTNFVDMDLKVVIDDGKSEIPKGNFLRVWKGPGRAATDQLQLTQFVCSVWSNL